MYQISGVMAVGFVSVSVIPVMHILGGESSWADLIDPGSAQDRLLRVTANRTCRNRDFCRDNPCGCLAVVGAMRSSKLCGEIS